MNYNILSLSLNDKELLKVMCLYYQFGDQILNNLVDAYKQIYGERKNRGIYIYFSLEVNYN